MILSASVHLASVLERDLDQLSVEQVMEAAEGKRKGGSGMSREGGWDKGMRKKLI